MNGIKVTTHKLCASLIQRSGNGKLNLTIPKSAGFDPRGGQKMTGSGGVPLILVSEDTLATVENDINTLFKATEKLKELSYATPPDLATSLRIITKAINSIEQLTMTVSRLHRLFESTPDSLDVPEIFYDGYCDDSGVL